MDSNDRKVLATQSDSTLANWWSILNRHEWPDGLPNPETSKASVQGRRWEIMCLISDRIGLKECLRDWNKERLPGNDFDDWYTEMHPNG